VFPRKIYAKNKNKKYFKEWHNYCTLWGLLNPPKSPEDEK